MIKIREKRLERHLTQAELAAKLEIAPSTVGMWENSERKPDIVMLKRIAVIFGCTTDELLSDIVIQDTKQLA